MKSVICINVGTDHIWQCATKKIAREGESLISQLEITLADELCDCWAYIDFLKPNGETFRTPGLEIIDNVIRYDIPSSVLDKDGYLKVQLILQNANGELWKSTVKTYLVENSIGATEEIPENEVQVIGSHHFVGVMGGNNYDLWVDVYPNNKAHWYGTVKLGKSYTATQIGESGIYKLFIPLSLCNPPSIIASSIGIIDGYIYQPVEVSGVCYPVNLSSAESGWGTVSDYSTILGSNGATLYSTVEILAATTPVKLDVSGTYTSMS